jgi:hypothetical protein
MTSVGKGKVVKDDPYLFLMISRSYAKAAKAVWDLHFQSQPQASWDWSLLLHPISQLLGVSFETALKGLLICRKGEAPASHNLKDLVDKLSGDGFEDQLSQSLGSLDIPQVFIDLNPKASQQELEEVYRRHHLHVETLNMLYDRPYASRYPVDDGRAGLNGFDPIAAYLLATFVQGLLDQEKPRRL